MPISFRFIFAFLIFSALLGCAGSDTKSKASAPVGRKSYAPLSEAEAKVYITPTIYYVPQFDLSQQNCAASAQKSLKDKAGAVLFKVCESVYDACLMQGTCRLKTEQGAVLINVAGKVASEYRFSKVQNKNCRFGFGGKSSCLDPFHSVAADLSIYKLGQVIYIPSVVGVALPDGTRHEGYFIVRDSGGNIKGHGRFDFFTGFLGRSQNPFSSIGFEDKNTHVHYYVVEASEAQSILKKRNYPLLPVFE